jgi:hypothetical protein
MWIGQNFIEIDLEEIYVQKKNRERNKIGNLLFLGFARGSPHSVLLAFSQSYVEHNLRKKKL